MPVITIFVRHKPGCKWEDEEFAKGCRCRKHFRWSQGGKQFRRAAGTRSWAEAEEQKRNLEAQLSGKLLPEAAATQTLEHAITVFKADKKNQGLTADIQGRYSRELARLQTFCEGHSVFTVQGITRELLVSYQSTWPDLYESSNTRLAVQARLRNFLRFCFDSKWLDRVPKTSRIKVDEVPTLPLNTKEYERLLKAVPVAFPDSVKAARVRGLVQCMRFSGLAIRDTVTLRQSELVHDHKKKLYRIVTSRQKTGTHVSVPIPPAVAKEILAVVNGNPEYIFWNTGNGTETTAVSHWQHDLRKLFREAGITGYVTHSPWIS